MSAGAPERHGPALATLEASTAQPLRSALSELLAPLCDHTEDDRIIVIDRLEITVSSNATLDPPALARVLAAELASAVARCTLRRSSAGVLVYDDAALRMAALLEALATGTAWNGWQFADRSGLRSLPGGVAIRTLTEENPALALAAWLSLPCAQRVRVAGRLDAIDALRCLGALAEASPGPPDHAALAALLGAETRRPEEEPASARLCRLLETCRSAPGISFAGLLACDDLLERMADCEASVLSALAAGQIRSFLQEATPLDMSERSLLASAPSELRRAASEMAAGDAETQPAALPSWTPYAGLLMLVPWIDLPEMLEPDLANRAILAVLAICAGEERAAMVLADPALGGVLPADPRRDMQEALAELSQVLDPAGDGDLSAAALPAEWCIAGVERKIAAIGARALAAFRSRLAGFDQASKAFLFVNLIGHGGTVVTALDHVHAMLDRPPLDVLLAISGLADRTVVLPDRRTLMLERAVQ